VPSDSEDEEEEVAWQQSFLSDAKLPLDPVLPVHGDYFGNVCRAPKDGGSIRKGSHTELNEMDGVVGCQAGLQFAKGGDIS